MSKNICCQDQVGFTPCARALGAVRAEEFDQRFDSFFTRDLAMFAAGSMPRQGIPAAWKFCRK